ncbi:MAG: hypothetical protein E7098_03085 [Mediterranea massiliensis]|nr:hypothetical protein [Mediterranea massiliensis]
MKKIIHSLFSILLIFTGCAISGCNSDDELYDSDIDKDLPAKYYWYRNEKITMIPVKSKSFILIDTNLCDKDKLPKADFKPYELGNISSDKTKHLQYATLNKRFDPELYKIDGIVYHSPFYIVGDATEAYGVSNLFYVKLKSRDNFGKLEELAKEYKIEILGDNKLLPLWFTLSCDKQSAGDAIDMANTFYESGLFEHAEPDIMGAVILY